MDITGKIEAVSFQTRARTIDHLGREQIADCPTAISELWKNAYDAYARSVELHIFDGEIPTAALTDDGHGMSRREFVEKWLVVGTESKFFASRDSTEDRNGLKSRPRQGQKGIGRLSAAALGPLLLVISKRRADPFVGALIDWRLFENPFLYLQDVEIPVVDFAGISEFAELLPQMFEKLMGNVWGNGKDRQRDERITAAWRQLDTLDARAGRKRIREEIESTLIEANFGSRQLESWPVWSGKRPSGTALLIASINFDLEAQLPRRTSDADESLVRQAKSRLLQTLSSFTDPFAATTDPPDFNVADEFTYSVTSWEGGLSQPVISSERSFGYNDLEDLEHVVEGVVNDAGIFRGKIKAFGNWLPTDVAVNPVGLSPTRADSRVGRFQVRIGTFEQVQLASSHPPEIHANLRELAENFAGFMVYRDGLRVMPYGREDNDFFEIEKRRTVNAGREFWSNRRLFGRVALTREDNPNLKDKAGREGLIDNKAAKAFRDIVENILITTARNYFGSSSDLRKQLLPDVKLAREQERAKQAEKQIRARKRKEFRHTLEASIEPLETVTGELEAIANQARSQALSNEEASLVALRHHVAELKQARAEYSLGSPPSTLGSMEADYRRYRQAYLRSGDLIANLTSTISSALEKVKPQTQRELAYSALSRNANYLHDRLRKWSAEARQILASEIARVTSVVEDRNKRYHSEALPLLDELEQLRFTITEVLERLESIKDVQDQDNAEHFVPYISTLRDLQESVDLETLVAVTLESSEDVRTEISRLNSLAQLGITVEIVGHEIEGLDLTISRGLKELSARNQGHPAFESVRTAHQALADRLRFLSPLKLSGDRSSIKITGDQVFEYVTQFMQRSLDERRIDFEATVAFRKFNLFEQPARIYPVFINLVNNAAYWVGQSKYFNKKIVLDCADQRVIVSDNGPGVEPDDIKRLFSLFFTRKMRGGRGVGLYLCRANLAAGGHTISYISDPGLRLLSGANFAIEFRGAQYE